MVPPTAPVAAPTVASPAVRPATTGIPPEFITALKRAIAPGPIIGALVAGAFMYIPTHQVSASMYSSVLMFLVIGALRAADGVLNPVWEKIALVPRPARLIASLVIPIFYSISRFQPDAAGQEIGRARGALIISAVIAYVLNRPKGSQSAKA